MNIQTLQVSTEFISLVAEIDEFKGSWRSLQNLAPERLASLRKVATIESIGSSTRIEGVSLTDREIEVLLSNLEVHSFLSRDEKEVAGYAEALEQVFESYPDIQFTENHIKQLHTMLLKYSVKDARHRGEYKKHNNHVEAFDSKGKSLGVVFETETPFKTPFKMKELVDWTRESLLEKTAHPLLIIGMFIVSFLAIHPFQDGNGRLSRILTTLLLLQSGYLYVPYSSLESIVEVNKEKYYLMLRKTQGTFKKDTPDWGPWLNFFLQALKKQKDKLETKLEREHILIESMPPLALQILELTKAHGKITISELEVLTKENRNTIKNYLRKMVENNQLIKCGKARQTWYVLA